MSTSGGNGKDVQPRPLGMTDEDLPQHATRLRRMNHREWLLQFAQVLSVSPNSKPSLDGSYRGMPMTPFRAGAITRLGQAAEYIALLEKDLVEMADRIDKLVSDLEDTGVSR